MDEVLLYLFVGHDVVQQESIWLAFTHGQALIQVVTGDNGSNRQDKGEPIGATQFGFIYLLAQEHVDGNAQAGGGNPGVVGNGDRVEVGVDGQGFSPQVQELAAAFAHTYGPFSRVRGQNSLQGTDSHTILGPVTGQVGVSGQEVGHDLLAGGLVPFAGVGGQHIDAGVAGEHFSYTFHAGHIGGMSGEAFDLDDVAFAAQLFSQPFCAGHGPFFLVDAHVVHAGDVQFLVYGDHDDAQGYGFFQGGIEAIDVTRVHQDGVHVLGHQVLELLDLPGHIGVGTFDHQFGGDALVHILLVGFDQFGDHLRAIFAADEGVRDTDGEGIIFCWSLNFHLFCWSFCFFFCGSFHVPGFFGGGFYLASGGFSCATTGNHQG